MDADSGLTPYFPPEEPTQGWAHLGLGRVDTWLRALQEQPRVSSIRSRGLGKICWSPGIDEIARQQELIREMVSKRAEECGTWELCGWMKFPGWGLEPL